MRRWARAGCPRRRASAAGGPFALRTGPGGGLPARRRFPPRHPQRLARRLWSGAPSSLLGPWRWLAPAAAFDAAHRQPGGRRRAGTSPGTGRFCWSRLCVGGGGGGRAMAFRARSWNRSQSAFPLRQGEVGNWCSTSIRHLCGAKLEKQFWHGFGTTPLWRTLLIPGRFRPTPLLELLPTQNLRPHARRKARPPKT